MNYKNKAEEIYKEHYDTTVSMYKTPGERHYYAIAASKITVGNIISLLQYFNEENAYRDDMKKSSWIKVRNQIDKL